MLPPRKKEEARTETVRGLVASQRLRESTGFLGDEDDEVVLARVGRDVATVDVQPCLQIWDEQPAGAAGDVERRLAGLDEPLESRSRGRTG
jgi:hypothetical protein